MTLSKRLQHWIKTQHGTAGWEFKLEAFIKKEKQKSYTEGIEKGDKIDDLIVLPEKKHYNWICAKCGKRIGKCIAGMATWHYGTCDFCGKPNAVTEPRDFDIHQEDDNV